MDAQQEADYQALIQQLQLDIQRLRVENADLAELSLFWSKFNDDRLRDAMFMFNKNPYGGPNCTCIKCRIGGRVDQGEPFAGPPDAGARCRFSDPFMDLLRLCGLDTVVYGEHAEVAGSGRTLEHPSALVMGCVYAELDPATDFHCPSGDIDFTMFSYGPAIWGCKSVRSEKIQRLCRLFDMLEAAEIAPAAISG